MNSERAFGKTFTKAGAALAALACMALACVAALVFSATLFGCAPANTTPANQEKVLSQYESEANALRIGSMKGPTSIGLADMMQKNQGQFSVVAAADGLTPLLLQDKIDIALVPANVAAMLYQKTNGEIRVIDVNTLGVLYGVSQDGSITNIEDLRGKTVYMTGKSTVPEYTFKALLAAANMSADDLKIEFCTEPTEVAAQITKDPNAVGILPQPFETAITTKNKKMKTVLDITAAWAEVTGGQKGDVITGVTIAKASTISAKEGAIKLFLARHASSVDAANSNPAGIAEKVAELGIIDNAKLAEKAIPNCNVVCLTGEDMKSALQGYLTALFAQDEKALGGAMPGDDFYYVAK